MVNRLNGPIGPDRFSRTKIKFRPFHITRPSSWNTCRIDIQITICVDKQRVTLQVVMRIQVEITMVSEIT